MFCGVRHREMRLVGPAGVKDRFRFVANFQVRHAHVVGNDLDVLPGYFPTPSGLEGFQKGFFRRKSSGVRLGRRSAFAFAVGTFLLREHAFRKTGSSGYRLLYAINFNNVDADGYDH